jgi:hypothetical protein
MMGEYDKYVQWAAVMIMLGLFSLGAISAGILLWMIG